MYRKVPRVRIPPSPHMNKEKLIYFFNKYKHKSGPVIAIFLAIFPVMLWFSVLPIQARIFSFSEFVINLGRIAGIFGISLFAVNLILSARIKAFEDYFGGLNNIYKWHGTFGKISFFALLLHPILFLPKFIPNAPELAVQLFLPVGNWQYILGVSSLYLMILFLVLTLYFMPKYNIWKLTHKLLGISFFLGALHALFIPSDVSSFLPLTLYIGGLSLTALLAYSYRTLFGKFFVKKIKCKVENFSKKGKDILEIQLGYINERLRFDPGQFLFITFNAPGLREVHPFSIVSAPSDGTLKIAVKNLGDYTSSLEEKLERGIQAQIEGPYGKLLDYRNKGNASNAIWIAGGIGITPFLGSARDLREDEKVTLYYAVKDEQEAVYFDYLSSIDNPNFRFLTHYSNQSGYLTAEKIMRENDINENTHFVICGPPQMMKSLKEGFVSAGINPENIHTEEFSL